MRTRAAVAVIILLAISLTGCGKSKKSSSSSGTTTTAAPKAVTTMDVTGKEYTFDGPNTVQAGKVKVTLTNAGTQDHQVQFLRLQDGKTLQDFAAAGAADPSGLQALALVDGAGGLNAISPGTNQSGVTDLRAGNWLMVCFVPAPDGKPHLAHGMIKPFVVTEPASTEAAPTADVNASAKDFQFTLPTFKSGTQTVGFANNGQQPHELALIKVATGKTANDVHQFFFGGAPPSGPPPFTEAGGPGAIPPGETTWATVNLTPGTYIAICHVPNAAPGANHGKEHALLGMFQSFTVT